MPRARKDGLVIKVLSDEVLVYDIERHQVHCLNRAAALVWQHCDGRTSVSQAAAVLREELASAADEDVIWLALIELRAANLLHAGASRKTEPARKISRRTLVRRLGVGVAASLPLITSIVAPQAAAAQTLDCSVFLDQASCEIPLKACSPVAQFFCRFRNGVCICTNA